MYAALRAARTVLLTAPFAAKRPVLNISSWLPRPTIIDVRNVSLDFSVLLLILKGCKFTERRREKWPVFSAKNAVRKLRYLKEDDHSSLPVHNAKAQYQSLRRELQQAADLLECLLQHRRPDHRQDRLQLLTPRLLFLRQLVGNHFPN